MPTAAYTILVSTGGALGPGKAEATIAGLRQKSASIAWRNVAHFRITDTSVTKHPVKKAVGAAVGAAMGSLLGPVGAVAGLAAGASTFGSKRTQTARLNCGVHGDIEFSCSAEAMKTILDWWTAHQRF